MTLCHSFSRACEFASFPSIQLISNSEFDNTVVENGNEILKYASLHCFCNL
ncbi:hypothetical protein T10_10460 [Trichinella papuae]|uniref:Uncharacterized protein n=1 Tax=Trichinella papuae TaxID=268474 RepID=A0A0V1LZE9_9BILA|nr:hypothetical protein T10_10460 [Trichinella papuae]